MGHLATGVVIQWALTAAMPYATSVAAVLDDRVETSAEYADGSAITVTTSFSGSTTSVVFRDAPNLDGSAGVESEWNAEDGPDFLLYGSFDKIGLLESLRGRRMSFTEKMDASKSDLSAAWEAGDEARVLREIRDHEEATSPKDADSFGGFE